MGRVDGKVALVAGAGGGIGGAGAEGLAREGAAVVCADIDAAAAEATAARIRRTGGRATAIALDVRDRAAVDAAVAATIREFGRLDVLLDSAGVSDGGSFLDLDHNKWERVIAVNLTGMFHLGQAAARQMVRQEGGGRSLTQAMALDLAPHGIRVNAIAPGPTLTGLTRARYADPEQRRQTIAQVPLGRLGDPEDLVGAILFLASDESRWATGSTVTVDGGYVIW